MILAWMGFTLLVTLLLAGAARVGERAAGDAGWTGLRWIWATAMALPGVLVLVTLTLSRLAPGESAAGIAEPGAHPVLLLDAGPTLPPALLVVHEGGWLERLDGVALAGWALLTVLLSLHLAAGIWRLRRRASGWPGVELPEGRVLVSPDTGPALLGLLRGKIVLPRWCLELDSDARRLILAHEGEHARSGDTLLLAGAWGLVLLAPWNVPLWWMHGRLQEAMELDCDARVLRRHPGERRRYGELLLLVAGRRSGVVPLSLAPFAERTSTLSRRIEMLTRTRRSLSRPRALLLAGGGLLLVGVACLVPGPDRMESPTGPAELEEARSDPPLQGGEELRRAPVFTPFSVAPEVRNRGEIGAALEAEYPPLLREAGVGGTVLIHLFINEEGDVENVLVAESSGHAPLDEAALRVGHRFELTPALNRDQPVPVWIQIPITFVSQAEVGDTSTSDAGAGGQAAGAAAAPGGGASLAELAREPTFTPFTQAPEVTNRGAVAEALEREYPALLRDAGVEGRALVHILIDAQGAVHAVEIADPSGHPALDDAALRVARSMTFAPARRDGDAVPVWIQIPLSFQLP